MPHVQSVSPLREQVWLTHQGEKIADYSGASHCASRQCYERRATDSCLTLTINHPNLVLFFRSQCFSAIATYNRNLLLLQSIENPQENSGLSVYLRLSILMSIGSCFLSYIKVLACVWWQGLQFSAACVSCRNLDVTNRTWIFFLQKHDKVHLARAKDSDI